MCSRISGIIICAWIFSAISMAQVLGQPEPVRLTVYRINIRFQSPEWVILFYSSLPSSSNSNSSSSSIFDRAHRSGLESKKPLSIESADWYRSGQKDVEDEDD